MKTTTLWVAGLVQYSAALSLQAQPAIVQLSAPTAYSLYAQQRIDMLPGFEATNPGFEAKIGQPGYIAGLWSAPLPWTPYIRPASDGGVGCAGLIGIHTHVLPNGKVLTWEGHNTNTQADPTIHASHAYVWNPSINGQDMAGNSYPYAYDHFDNDDSNIFCSGHAFLPDGRLLVAGGHYSKGEDGTIPNDALIAGASNGYVGLKDVNIFNYTGSQSPNNNYVWRTRLRSCLS